MLHPEGNAEALTACQDTTRIENDENAPFLGTSFLNNPAIEFPEYVIGEVFHRQGAETTMTSIRALANVFSVMFREAWNLDD